MNSIDEIMSYCWSRDDSYNDFVVFVITKTTLELVPSSSVYNQYCKDMNTQMEESMQGYDKALLGGK